MEIPLSNGGVALIDDDDYPIVAPYEWAWCKNRTNSRVFYAHAYNVFLKRMVLMHRLLLGDAVKGVTTDHKNRNGLDNRRINLRPATPTQNGANSERYRHNTSGFKGVCRLKGLNKWTAYLYHHKLINLGRFPSPMLAALAYDQAALATWGQFAKLNFPNPASL